jgi:UDP:flavonoid glycosyltransferase YjiC (YdhE family)
MAARRFDVVIASDFRLPGGNSASIAEEIKAQAKAGYTTALLHSTVHERDRPFNPAIRRCIEDGLATLLTGSDPIDTRLLMIRHPRALRELPPAVAHARADVTLVVVNQPPADGTKDTPFYDVGAIANDLNRSLGAGVAWIPIGPLARRSMEAYRSTVNLLDWDWVNVIDVDEWEVPRTSFVSDRPVIGRHSRSDWQKWPDSPEVILAAYPESDRYRVRILGGVDVARQLLRRQPRSWEVFPFNAISPREFLAQIDFYVYYHHPGYVEAFGRAILESLASGAVTIVPEHFRALFGDACIYAEPSEVTSVVDRLYADWSAYQERSKLGVQFVRDTFGQEVHIRRVGELIGPPSGSARRYATCRSTAPRRVLMVTSNGNGLGHLVRLMAVARRSSRDVQPVFFTLSTAYSFVQRLGWPVEYMTSRQVVDWRLGKARWNEMLRQRLQSLIDTHKPDVVVFDGTNPYDGLITTRYANPKIAFVWSRRGMWKPGMNESSIARADDFDLVVEPGEFAAAVDTGATTRDPRSVVRVNPIILLDEEDLVDRATARRELGLDPDQPAALVQLRVGGADETTSAVGRVLDLLTDTGVQVCVAGASPAGTASIPGLDVRYVSVFPMSKYSHAFDFGLTTAGYNSYHEAIGFALPTIFIPKELAELDDQHARARYAETAGVGLCVEQLDDESLERAVEIMLNETARRNMANRCRELFPGNGAQEASLAIETAMPTAKARRSSPGGGIAAVLGRNLGKRLSGWSGGKSSGNGRPTRTHSHAGPRDRS